ncbi:peptidase S8/S53 domain-containing protein [Mariannaea sp. PMI_226]|nr:peptidase S8/S53 domain-containing protein [Mariannaea sp. PMI_226]
MKMMVCTLLTILISLVCSLVLMVAVSDGEPGTFDSVIRPASHITDSPAEKTFSELQRIIRHHFCYKEKDKRVKIAILDTGIDGDHPDFQRPRAKRLTFVDDVIEHADAKGEIPQCQRITAFKDFCSDSEGEKLVDVDGHGTYIAGIILRLAPWADLVVARVCFGDVNRGVPSTQRRQTSRKNRDETRPDPTVVARAIEWATEQGADLINASFGYNEYQPVIEAALMKAEKHGILTFAATSNEGNHQDVAYPARSNFTIGVHSCNDMGTRSSEFTPSAQPRDHNFMAIGENIISQWSSSKGGSYRIGSGTSFATPVVTAMAALILAFANQTMSSQSRAQFLSEEDIRRLKERNGMAAVLAALSKGVHENKYLWIRPTLLWCNFDRTGPDSSDEHAWRVLKDALRHR